MKVGSLFSGIGGLELGLEHAGMEVKWQVERDDYANRVLEKHWPSVKRFRDVRECGSHNLEPVDLICGGFPCQPHSLAGKRKASEDERDLWGEFARIIREVRPKWVVAENVPGLLSSEAGQFFGRVLRDLAAIGYDAEWDCIPASAFGAPHQRDRVFIIAYPNSIDGWIQQVTRKGISYQTITSDDGSQKPLADATCERRREERQFRHDESEERISSSSEALADSDRERLPKPRAFRGQSENPRIEPSSWWESEPNVGRVVDGVFTKMDRDRIRCIGNAVVPQVSEWIGKMIMGAIK